MAKFKEGDRVIIHAVVREIESDDPDDVTYAVDHEDFGEWIYMYEDSLELDTTPIPEPAVGAVVKSGGVIFLHVLGGGWVSPGSSIKETWEYVCANGSPVLLAPVES